MRRGGVWTAAEATIGTAPGLEKPGCQRSGGRAWSLACSVGAQAGGAAPEANRVGMTQPDRSSEPYVSPDELRAALAPRGRSRPSPVASGVATEEREPAPAWEWDTELSDGDQAELVELRATVETQRGRIEALETEASESRAAGREAREALSAFAVASPWQRRALRRELSERGLL